MNIIDSLVVTLGLDPSNFKAGAKDAAAASAKLAADMAGSADDAQKAQALAAEKIVKALGRIADQGDKLATGTEGQHKKVKAATDKSAESVLALGKRVLGLYALLTAGKGLKEFVSGITEADAALGRTAKNLDMTGRNLSAWQNAATVAGGSAEGITGTLKGLTSEMQRAALTGESGIIPVFRALGINLAEASGKARDAGDVLVDLNRKAQGMDPARFTALAHMAGIDDGTIALLEKSTAEFDKLRAEQTKYAATAEDIDAAQKRQSGWRQLLITSQSLGRTILTELTPAIVGADGAVQRWADANQEWIKTKIVDLAADLAKWIKSVDWAKVAADVGVFAGAVRDIAVAVAGAVSGVDGDSSLSKALEALAVLAGVRLVASFAGLKGAIGSLGAVALPGWFSAILSAAGITTTALAVGGAADAEMARRTGAAMTGGDPSAKFDPETGFVNDLDFGYDKGGERANGSQAWSWFKGLFGGGSAPANTDGNALHRNDEATPGAARGGLWDSLKRLVGLGDDPKTKDAISDTAKATGEIRDLMKADKDKLGSGIGMDTAGGGGRGEYGGHSGAPSIRYGRQHESRGGSAPVAPFKLTGNQAAQLGDGIRLAAQHLGIKPEDLGTVISYETGGTMDPWKAGPHTKWGQHRGLIQWGEPQAKAYGVTKDSTIGQQMAAVERYLRDAGVKPGMGILDVYSAINAGHVGKYGASDGYGTVSSHVDRMTHSAHRTALARLDSQAKGGLPPASAAAPAAAPSAPTPAPAPSTMTEAEVREAEAWMHSLGVDHPLTQAEHDRMGPLQKRLDAYYASRPPPGPMVRPKVSGPAPRSGPEISPEGRRQRDLDAAGASQFPKPHAQARTLVGDMPAAPPSGRPARIDAVPTLGHAVHAMLHAMARANRLTHHNDNHPVEVTDKGVLKLQERTFGAYLKRAKKHLDIMPPASSIHHAASLNHALRVASAGRYAPPSVHHTAHSETRIGEMHVHPQTGDGRQFAGEFRRDMLRRGDVTQANGALV